VTELASKQQLRMSFLRWAIVTVPAVLLLGLLAGASASGADNAWYQALAKPPLTPPDWVFPAVWTALYILLGLALAMVLNARRAPGRGIAVLLFVAELLINLSWDPIFFGAHHVLMALVLIVAMLLIGLAVAISFGRIRAAAGWLLVPYLAWLCFAAVLTWGIHALNPGADALVPSTGSTQIAL